MKAKENRNKKGKIEFLLILLVLALSLEGCFTLAEVATDAVVDAVFGTAENVLFEEGICLSDLKIEKQSPDVVVVTGKVKYVMPILHEKKKFVDISHVIFVFTLADEDKYQVGHIYGKPEIGDGEYTLEAFPVDTLIDFEVSQKVESVVWKNAAIVKDWKLNY